MDTGIVIDSEFVLAEAEYLPEEIEDTGPEEVCLDYPLISDLYGGPALAPALVDNSPAALVRTTLLLTLIWQEFTIASCLTVYR